MPDPIAVQSMFGRIAHRYDLANRLLSFGMDTYWRRQLVAAVRGRKPGQVLDVATGSGDVAFALAQALGKSATITGMDFCQPMLDRALARQAAADSAEFAHILFRIGDLMRLPDSADSYDAVSIAFGLRNVADRHRGLVELRRVLRPGGRLFVLEFSQPKAWLKPAYYLYLRRTLPWLAGVLTGDRNAYEYLNKTIGEFPGTETLAAEISAAGFKDVSARQLTFGIVALHEAVK